MTITQSGYPVHLTSAGMSTLRVAGVSFGQCIAGPVRTVLEWAALQFNATVSALKSGQCGAWAPRQIRGGRGWSNHASSSAIDCNTLEFPQGTRRMSTKQIAACRVIVAASGGVLRWGGDYAGSVSVDQQHFEIADGLAGTGRVEALAARITGTPTDPDLLEWIMTLSGAPKDLTYQKLLRDIADTVLDTPLESTDYSVRPTKPRKGTVRTSLRDNSNFSSGAAYNAGQASKASKAALAELQEGMQA